MLNLFIDDIKKKLKLFFQKILFLFYCFKSSLPPLFDIFISCVGAPFSYKEAIRGIPTNGKKLKVAVMGCVVNGPGEAREADFGIAGGDGFVMFFKNGQPMHRIEECDAVNFLVEETKKALNED